RVQRHNSSDWCDVRSKRAEQYAKACGVNDALDPRHEPALRAADALSLGVGGVAQQQQHPVVAEPSEALHVGAVAPGRVLFQLEVARVHDASDRRLDSQSGRARDAMTDRDRLDTEGAELNTITEADGS